MISYIYMKYIYIYIFYIYRDSKNKMNEQTYQNRNRVIDAENKPVVVRGEGSERGKTQIREKRGTNFQLQNKCH